MAYTKQQIAAQALRVLGVLGSGQTISAEDMETMTPIIDGTAAICESEGVCYLVPDLEADDVPAEAFLPFATVVAKWAASSYGVGGQDLAGIQMLSDVAESTLRSFQPSGRGDQPTEADYF